MKKVSRALGGIKRLFNRIKNYSDTSAKDRSFELSPADGMNTVSVLVGMGLRGLAVFVGILGLQLFLFDAVGVYDPSADFRTVTLSVWVMAVFSFLFSMLAAFAPYNKITKIVIPTGSFAVLAVSMLVNGNPLSLVENVFRYLFNSALRRLASSGFLGFSSYMLGTGYQFDAETLTVWSSVLISVVLGVLMYFFVIRRASIVANTVLIALFFAPVFTYNMPRTNGGFALTVAYISAVLALFAFDYRYGGRYAKNFEKKKEKRLKREERKKTKARARLERLDRKCAAEKLYSAALTAQMGKKRARAVVRTFKKRLLTEKRKEDKENKKASKKAREAAKKELRAEKRLLRRDRDRVKVERKEKEQKRKKISAAGGFAGAAIAVVVLLAAWIPSAVTTKPFRTIEAIDGPISEARNYLTDVLMGGSVDLNSSELYSESEKFDFEKVTFDERTFEDTVVFRAESGREIPIYFRSRFATDYDADNGTWSYPTGTAVMEYESRFGEGFSPDTITSNAYSYLWPQSAQKPTSSFGNSFAAFGFTVQKIGLQRFSGGSKLLFLPSVFSSSIGVLDADTSETTDLRYYSFFDGVFTSRELGKIGDGYASVAYVHLMGDPKIGDLLEDEAAILESALTLSKGLVKGDTEYLFSEYAASVSSLSVSSDLGERILEMTEAERDDFEKSLESELKYREYAKETYSTSIDSDRISELAETILKEAEEKKGAPLNTHEKVRAVIDHLGSDEFTYSLSPKKPSRSDTDVIEAFLFETKEGYCTHFSTAATLLLRSAGVTVRYTEGYLADNWYHGYRTLTGSEFISDITDGDAHTWIEVYYDGIGWINYETTKSFTDGMYSTDYDEDLAEESGDGEDETLSDPNTDYSDDKTMEEIIASLEEKGIDWSNEKDAPPTAGEIWLRFKIVIAVIAGLMLLYVAFRIVIAFFKRRAKRDRDARFVHVKNAQDERFYKDLASDKKEAASEMIRSMFTILNAAGLGPKKGELLSEYGSRMDREFGDISGHRTSEIAGIVTKSEYGNGLSFKEMCALAEYYTDITVSVYTGLSFGRKIKLRYFDRII